MSLLTLGFLQAPKLLRHVEQKHEKADRHVCDLCGQWFSNIDTLKMHQIRHNTKPCQYCGKVVADMRQHIRVVHFGSRRGGIISIPGLDSQGRPLGEGQMTTETGNVSINDTQGRTLVIAQTSIGTGDVPMTTS